MQDNELYWNDTGTEQVKITCIDQLMTVIFSYKDTDFACTYSGRIQLKLTTEPQIAYGTIEYHYNSGGIEYVDYELRGVFEDNEFEYFKGEWLENGSKDTFELFVEDQDSNEKTPEKIQSVTDVQAEEQTLSTTNQSLTRSKGIRRRAVRGDARVKNIQRKIELDYGLPEGSVKLHDPEQKMSPLAKISTLRERWDAL